MISLITGAPGSGKTSLLVSMLMEREDLQNRPLFVDGISELKIEHHQCPDNQDMTKWHEWAPTGSILVIDECQRVFRPRANGSKVPDYVAHLETHRHKGIDFFLITQSPRLIDINVRHLVGNHRHISMTNLGVRRIMEWQKCGNPESNADVQSALTSVFRLKKQAFGMYHSAEEHTKIKTKKSIWFYLFPFLIIFLLLSFYYVYSFVSDLTDKDKNSAVATATVEPLETVATGAQATGADVSKGGQLELGEGNLKPEEFEPSINGKPWTRPIYNSMNRNFVSMEYPDGCIINKRKKTCTCYTSQGTPIRQLDDGLCHDFAENGIFNPYKKGYENEQ